MKSKLIIPVYIIKAVVSDKTSTVVCTNVCVNMNETYLLVP